LNPGGRKGKLRDFQKICYRTHTYLKPYAFLLQIIPAFYKSRTGGPEEQQELDKQLTEFEKELGDKKFVGGEVPPILKQMMQI